MNKASQDKRIDEYDLKQSDLEKIKKLIKDRVSDGDLSDSDVNDILKETKNIYKDAPLTEKDIRDLAETLNNSLEESYAQQNKVPKGLKVFGILVAVSSIIEFPALIDSLYQVIAMFSGSIELYTATTIVLAILYCLLSICLVVLCIVIGVLMFLGKRVTASRTLLVAIAVNCIDIIITLSLSGASIYFILLIVLAVIQIALSVYLNPHLHKERQFYKKLKLMDSEQRAKEGRLGRAVDEDRGFIELDFFNLFWIFVICSIIGLIAEDVYHVLFVWEPGTFKDRAGLLWGPFSPIYGFGGLIMTVCLNRFYKKNPIILFVICTVLGGAFEYFVSVFLEVGFGIVAWDYTGYFMNINGRTCLMFASMFGVMGFVWIKWLLPKYLQLMSKIPIKWRYPVTTVFAIFMLINCIMTVQALDCWSQRVAGKEPVTPIEQFYEKNFDDDWMANRFESMTIDPDKSAREELDNNAAHTY